MSQFTEHEGNILTELGELANASFTRRGFLAAGALALAGCRRSSSSPKAIDPQTVKSPFQIVSLRGGPEQRGLAQGEILKPKIDATWQMYQEYWGDLPIVRELAEKHGAAISRHLPEAAQELNAIARSAGLESWKIYAMNSRTEILSQMWAASECTVVVFRDSAILGQNWDWNVQMLDLAVLLDIELENGRKILALSEPGMMGKIGMNSAGVGVALNFLYLTQETDGIPVHVLLRTALEQGSTEEALARFRSLPIDTASAITIADGGGDVAEIEIAAEQLLRVREDDNIGVHTNHYLRNLGYRPPQVDRETRVRKDRLEHLIEQNPATTVAAMKRLLADQDYTTEPILVPISEDPELGPSGTIASMVMDLKQKQFHIAMPNRGVDYRTFQL